MYQRNSFHHDIAVNKCLKKPHQIELINLLQYTTIRCNSFIFTSQIHKKVKILNKAFCYFTDEKQPNRYKNSYVGPKQVKKQVYAFMLQNIDMPPSYVLKL